MDYENGNANPPQLTDTVDEIRRIAAMRHEQCLAEIDKIEAQMAALAEHRHLLNSEITMLLRLLEAIAQENINGVDLTLEQGEAVARVRSKYAPSRIGRLPFEQFRRDTAAYASNSKLSG